MKYQAIAVTALKKVLPALALLVLLVLVVAWLAGAFTKKDPGSQTAVAGDHRAGSPTKRVHDKPCWSHRCVVLAEVEEPASVFRLTRLVQ